MKKDLIIKIVQVGRRVLKLVFIGALLVKIIVLLIEPSLVDAASPPWTITTEYGEIDGVHHTPHNGIDYAVPEGTPIKSIVDGRVEIVKDEGNISFGKSVRIRTPDGKLVIYGHLKDWTVRPGQVVHFGDVIGHSGNTGHSTGPHLHFQVNINGKPVDPHPTIWEGMMRKALTKIGGE
jgi:murein DD-endopeptidase MepM/ murein hydrolase activator NlpD